MLNVRYADWTGKKVFSAIRLPAIRYLTSWTSRNDAVVIWIMPHGTGSRHIASTSFLSTSGSVCQILMMFHKPRSIPAMR